MNLYTLKNKKGFTIIEVVLVLAVAGLIFLMVFLALPALQRSQRDTQRKQDLSRWAAAIASYKSANPNSLIAPPYKGHKMDDIIKNYLKDDFRGPTGDPYRIGYIGTFGQHFPGPKKTIDDSDTSYTELNRENIYYAAKARCGESSNTIEEYGGYNSFALLVKLESSNNFACIDAQ